MTIGHERRLRKMTGRLMLESRGKTDGYNEFKQMMEKDELRRYCNPKNSRTYVSEKYRAESDSKEQDSCIPISSLTVPGLDDGLRRLGL
ncbi:uncharacterized protein RAG0_13985 [Rhynchosporium agropyri]|uniref:Uncharacterized protein n=2 Tax=Rhynchosporium TaxID=38037 RepID=A0A1E1MU20_RHYSE|nr:uncharacterized protein RAG0_13985 [Rhynchosporium agropyri]CZT52572.1 uncharacterized protein RSE6_13918 [Rhynchosporium secalis]